MSDQKKTFKFQSPLLRKMPDPFWAQRIKQIRFNAIVLAGIVGVCWFVYVTPFEEDQDIIQTLYRLHDELYLPIKGYSFNQFFPYAWIWWGTTVVLIAVTIFAFVLTTRWTRELQIYLTTRLMPMMRFTREYRLFSGSAQFLKSFGIEPQLLFTIVHNLREKILIELEKGQGVGRFFRPRIVPLNTLWLRLSALAPNAPIQKSIAHILMEWHRLYLVLHHYQDEFRPELGYFLTSIKYVNWPVVGDSDGIDPFSLGQLWVDTQNLILLGMDHWGLAEDADRVGRARALLISSAERRKYYLDASAQRIEQRLQKNANPNDIYQDQALPPLTAPSLILPDMGQLSLLIDLHTAYFCDFVDLAYGLLESYELLHFLLEWETGADNRSLRLLVKEKPTIAFYLILSDLVEAELRRRKNDWLPLFEQKDVVRESDLALLEQRVALLKRAKMTEVS